MELGEIISIVAVVISFLGLIVSFIFSYRKIDKERDTERENNIRNITMIKEDIKSMAEKIENIEVKLSKIDEATNNYDKAFERNTQRIIHLEKEVFGSKQR